jgi:hypothetical protein
MRAGKKRPATAPDGLRGGLGFPWRGRHLILPRETRRATAAGLGLYDATLLHQRFAVHLADALIRTGMSRGLRRIRDVEDPGIRLLRRWLLQGGTSWGRDATHAAVVTGVDRAHALLLVGDGCPHVFVKARREDPDLYRSALEEAAINLLQNPSPRTFRVPALRHAEDFCGWHVQVFDPLPEGLHRRPRHDPDRLVEVVSELQQRLDSLAVSTATDEDVVCHGDFTPRNLRLTADGTLWLTDWEYARPGPRLADELRYWTVEFATRGIKMADRHGRRIVQLLRRRGTDEEIVHALRGREFLTPYEQRLRAAVRRHLGS